MAYDVSVIGNMQVSASGLRNFARKCINSCNSRVSIMANPCITGVYDLSRILYENNPHVYLNPTEKLHMGEYVKEGDTVATVFGSGDFALDAVCHGAKKVVGFDINQIQYPIGALKIIAMGVLEPEEFYNFFSAPGSNLYLEREVYEKIKNDFPDNIVYMFWDKMIRQFELDKNNVSKEPLYSAFKYYISLLNNGTSSDKEREALEEFKNIFGVVGDGERFDSIIYYALAMRRKGFVCSSKIANLMFGLFGFREDDSYLTNAELFNLTKQNLKDADISFLKSSLLELKTQLLATTSINKDFSLFDTIYLSNAPEYIDGHTFSRAISEELMPLLKDNGQIVYCCQAKNLSVLESGVSSAVPAILTRGYKNPFSNIQEYNDIVALRELRNRYSVSYDEVPTLSTLNGNGATDVYVKIKK